MSSNDERIVTKQKSCNSSGNVKMSLTISISTVTGHQWKEEIALSETVDSLKVKIWHRTGLFPYHQGLTFGDLSLSEFCGRTLLWDLGIRHNSLVRLVIVTRSGPLAITFPEKIQPASCSSKAAKAREECWEGLRIFDEKNLDENRRTLFRMCELRRHMKQNASAKSIINTNEKQVFSAPEDTSAKESSAGDTECDDDKSCSCGGIISSAKASEAVAKNEGKRSQNSTKGDRLLMFMHPRTVSPAADVNTHSEDGSEFSSGMVICDLSNEFRRLRVRRKHHVVGGGSTAVQRTRARSKPRTPLAALSQHRGSDVTSSDDERPHRRIPEPNFSCSSFRRSTAVSRGQKVLIGYQSQQRCSACAIKLSSFSVAFQCRCGKTLCARHRPAEMHTCTRVRKMQDVSD